MRVQFFVCQYVLLLSLMLIMTRMSTSVNYVCLILIVFKCVFGCLHINVEYKIKGLKISSMFNFETEEQTSDMYIFEKSMRINDKKLHPTYTWAKRKGTSNHDHPVLVGFTI